jgi:hypothetical protein
LTLRGWVQGYNAQAVCTEEQIVIAAEVTIASPDFGQLEPMVTATETELAAAGVTTRPRSCWPTPAPGTPNRSNASPAAEPWC